MTSILRYYQSLLKSIPATITKAEDHLSQKTRLSGLPDTGDAILQIISLQQELARRIERHIEFFIKWDQQTELGLPQALKNALKQMPEQISKYADILTLQADSLKTKNTPKYLVLFDDEQKLHEEIDKLFDKPLYTKQTKSSTLYNLAYSLGKAVISPVSKVIVALTFAVLLTFPSILMPSMPIIQPRQATTISAPRIDAEQFANSMRKHGWKIRILKASPDKPTLIIKEDEHQSDTAELEFVNQAREEQNINHVAMEGWAGEAEDSVRGKTVLNAEEEFVKIMLKDPGFYKRGLEDAELQEEALKIMIFQTLQYLISLNKSCEQDITNLENQIQELQQKKQKLFEELPKEAGKKEILEDIESIDRQIARQNKTLASRIKNQQLYTMLKERMPQTYEKNLKECGVTLQDVENIYADLLEKDTEELMQIKDNIVRIKRSELWAQKVAVWLSRHKSMIVVMGRGHTESFLNKLQQLGEYNIVIIEPYPE